MNKKGWLVAAALVAGGVVFARGGCLNQTTKAPDQRLASRLDDLCKIAREGAKAPVAGVKKLGAYMGKHTGDMLGDFGATIATIERITDDKKHDARAALARDRWHAVACPADWMRFDDAIQKNPEATALMTHFAERLNRTLEIILGSGAMPTLSGLDLELPVRGLGPKAGGAAGADVAKP